MVPCKMHHTGEELYCVVHTNMTNLCILVWRGDISFSLRLLHGRGVCMGADFSNELVQPLPHLQLGECEVCF